MNDRPTSRRGGENQDFHLDEHLCLDLLQGFLGPEEEKRILSHLAACAACEKLFQERAAEGVRLEATRVLVAKPGGELALERRGTAARAHESEGKDRPKFDFLSQLATDVLAGFKRPRFQVAAGLAAAAVVVSLITWYQYVSPPGVSDLHLLPSYSFQLQVRETPEAVAARDLKTGLEAYDGEDFRRAVQLLERAGVSELGETREMIRRIYLGSALAWLGRYEEAVDVMEEVSLTLLPEEWGGEAQWTLYVVLRESGREASADSLVQVLAKKPGEVGERARRLSQGQERD